MKKIIIIFLSLFSIVVNSQSQIVNSKAAYLSQIPILDKEWSLDEYENTFNLIIENKINLPNLQDSSSALFKKLTNMEDLYLLNDTNIKPYQKFQTISSLESKIGGLVYKYIDTPLLKNNKLKFGSEIIRLQIDLLFLTQKILEITDQFLIDNPTLNENQKNGLAKITHGLNTVISSSFTTITKDYKSYADVCDFSNYAINFYNKNRHYLDINAKKEFDDKIIKDFMIHKLDCIKSNANNFINSNKNFK